MRGGEEGVFVDHLHPNLPHHSLLPNDQADTKDLSSSSKFSASCVLT